MQAFSQAFSGLGTRALWGIPIRASFDLIKYADELITGKKETEDAPAEDRGFVGKVLKNSYAQDVAKVVGFTTAGAFLRNVPTGVGQIPGALANAIFRLPNTSLGTVEAAAGFALGSAYETLKAAKDTATKCHGVWKDTVAWARTQRSIEDLAQQQRLLAVQWLQILTRYKEKLPETLREPFLRLMGAYDNIDDDLALCSSHAELGRRNLLQAMEKAGIDESVRKELTEAIMQVVGTDQESIKSLQSLHERFRVNDASQRALQGDIGKSSTSKSVVGFMQSLTNFSLGTFATLGWGLRYALFKNVYDPPVSCDSEKGAFFLRKAHLIPVSQKTQDLSQKAQDAYETAQYHLNHHGWTASTFDWLARAGSTTTKYLVGFAALDKASLLASAGYHTLQARRTEDPKEKAALESLAGNEIASAKENLICNAALLATQLPESWGTGRLMIAAPALAQVAYHVGGAVVDIGNACYCQDDAERKRLVAASSEHFKALKPHAVAALMAAPAAIQYLPSMLNSAGSFASHATEAVLATVAAEKVSHLFRAGYHAFQGWWTHDASEKAQQLTTAKSELSKFTQDLARYALVASIALPDGAMSQDTAWLLRLPAMALTAYHTGGLAVNGVREWMSSDKETQKIFQQRKIEHWQDIKKTLLSTAHGLSLCALRSEGVATAMGLEAAAQACQQGLRATWYSRMPVPPPGAACRANFPEIFKKDSDELAPLCNSTDGSPDNPCNKANDGLKRLFEFVKEDPMPSGNEVLRALDPNKAPEKVYRQYATLWHPDKKTTRCKWANLVIQAAYEKGSDRE